jgi:hypothetical protein
MAKRPTTNTIGSGFYGTNTLNDNFDAIDTAFDNTISRDGSSPNSMSADFDMNNNDILNVNTIDVVAMSVNGVGVTPGDLVATPAAGSITITDSGGYYAASNVEAALQEIQVDLAAESASITAAVAAGYQPLDAQLTALAATSVTGVSGSDVTLITGTAGTDGNFASWNADGDLVDSSVAVSSLPTYAEATITDETGTVVEEVTTTGFTNVTLSSAYYKWVRVGGFCNIFGRITLGGALATSASEYVSIELENPGGDFANVSPSGYDGGAVGTVMFVDTSAVTAGIPSALVEKTAVRNTRTLTQFTNGVNQWTFQVEGSNSLTYASGDHILFNLYFADYADAW